MELFYSFWINALAITMNSASVLYNIIQWIFQPATKTLEPKWLEQFDLHIYEEQTLDIRVLDKRKDIFMGRYKRMHCTFIRSHDIGNHNSHLI